MLIYLSMLIHYSTNDTILRMIAEGKSTEIGAEKLKSLLKIMPESHEVIIVYTIHNISQEQNNIF